MEQHPTHSQIPFTLLRDRYYQLRQKPMMGKMSFAERFEEGLALHRELLQNDHYPYRREMDGYQLASDPASQDADAQWVNLASNDYLGFTRDPRIKEAAARHLEDFGAGSGSVPMLAGTYSVHRELENELASFVGYPSALVYNSGYAANYGLLSALLTPGDVAILDTQAHASIIDGCAGASLLYFKHNDPESLKQALQKAKSFANKLVIVDGVYSMTGDVAPMRAIIDMASENGALVMVDESHAIGVMGPEGRGTQAYQAIAAEAAITTGSLGKAMGGIGGYVAGPAGLISLLELNCRPFIFSASLPPSTAAGLLAGVQLLQQQDSDHLLRLWSNVAEFRQGLIDMGFPYHSSESAIIALPIWDDEKIMQLTRSLYSRNVMVNPVFYPVVSKRNSLIRVSVTASMSKAQLQYALDQLEQQGRAARILE